MRTEDERPVERPRPRREEGPQLLITLYVLAQRGRAFPGPVLAEAAKEFGLMHGPMGIYHLSPGGGSADDPVFSMANALEPGTFDPARMVGFSTPGVVFFLRLPGPVSPKQALAAMAKVADGMAERLGGEVCDETRCKLTAQAVRRLREKVEAFELERRVFDKREGT